MYCMGLSLPNLENIHRYTDTHTHTAKQQQHQQWKHKNVPFLPSTTEWMLIREIRSLTTTMDIPSEI